MKQTINTNDLNTVHNVSHQSAVTNNISVENQPVVGCKVRRILAALIISLDSESSV